ncbi:hypothetical protein SLE2022_094430 [Rubroshorea leprosula]
MFSVCSATSSCSSHLQVPFHGGLRHCTPLWKDFQSRCTLEDKSVLTLSNGTHLQNISFKPKAIKSFYCNVDGSTDQSLSVDLIKGHSCQNKLDDVECNFSTGWSSLVEAINEPSIVQNGKLKYVDSTSISMEEEFVDLTNQSAESSNNSIQAFQPETVSPVDITSANPTSISGSLKIGDDMLSGAKSSLADFLAGVNESFNSSVNKGEDAVKSSLDKVTSSLTSITESASEAIDNAFSRVFSAVDQTGELTGNKFSSLSNDLKEASSKATTIALDLIRHTVVVVEDSLSYGASNLVYYYASAKDRLPPEIKDGLNLFEDRAIKVLEPVRAAFEKGYIAIEGLERNLGLDPNDPIVPFTLFLGTSTTLWLFYWLWRYGGYSGDLSPKLTLELLSGNEKAVLIDIRPEVFRERDGIPDLRRAARFRYASVTLPEVNGTVRKLLKGGRDLDDTLVAAVIRNLKTVHDRSRVIVMDADGNRSKGVARSLRKLGVKRPYMVQGGFRSWMKQGLRIKELKPETALTILNEDAEAILEDVNPSPVQLLGYGLGLVAAWYVLLEWEKTLQFIGVIGLGQTIYRRVASYNDADDFKKDVRLLLTPVKAGAQAFSWAAGKIESNRIGLPTSPSSSDVQNRVVQAAAKHESQPSETEGIQGSESVAPVTENVDLSEA